MTQLGQALSTQVPSHTLTFHIVARCHSLRWLGIGLVEKAENRGKTLAHWQPSRVGQELWLWWMDIRPRSMTHGVMAPGPSRPQYLQNLWVYAQVKCLYLFLDGMPWLCFLCVSCFFFDFICLYFDPACLNPNFFIFWLYIFIFWSSLYSYSCIFILFSYVCILV